MLTSSETFVQHYFWKYLDITINKEEYLFIKNNFPTNPDIHKLLSRFDHIFASDADMQNYMFILSQLQDMLLQRFLMFYSILVYKHIGKISDKPKTIVELDEFIGDDDKLMQILLISAHYYL